MWNFETLPSEFQCKHTLPFATSINSVSRTALLALCQGTNLCFTNCYTGKLQRGQQAQNGKASLNGHPLSPEVSQHLSLLFSSLLTSAVILLYPLTTACTNSSRILDLSIPTGQATCYKAENSVPAKECSLGFTVSATSSSRAFSSAVYVGTHHRQNLHMCCPKHHSIYNASDKMKAQNRLKILYISHHCAWRFLDEASPKGRDVERAARLMAMHGADVMK